MDDRRQARDAHAEARLEALDPVRDRRDELEEDRQGDVQYRRQDGRPGSRGHCGQAERGHVQARLAVLAVVLAMSVAHATPSEDLALARQAFRTGQYQVALEKYNALLRPSVQLANSSDLVEAYVNLGVCRVETGDADGAK